MSRTSGVSHRLYSALYLLVIAMIGTYCVLNATYTAFVGGSPFYFFAVLTLMIQASLALRNSAHTRNIAGLGLLVLVSGLVYTYGLTFLDHLKAIVIVPSICLTIFGITSISDYPAKLKMLKVLLVAALIAMAIIQSYELTLLKDSYASLPSDEIW